MLVVISHILKPMNDVSGGGGPPDLLATFTDREKPRMK